MATGTDVPSAPATAEVSLVRGGPFYRVQHALGLIRLNDWDLGRRITFMVAVGWLPLFVITALLNPDGLISLIRDYRVHSRLLVAVPVLLIGELLVESRFRAVIGHLRLAGLLDASELAHVDAVIATIIRARDSFLPEFVILLLLVVHTVTSFKGLVDTTPWLSHASGAELKLTAAGWYAVLVSTSIFQFLLGLALWKWLLWTFFAFKLSRRNLKLVPTHPDRHGGLGFLGLTSAGFAPIAFSATAVIAATWRQDILHHGAHLVNFKLPAIVLVALTVLVALGPLAFFVPRLAGVRRKGILDYGILGQLHGAEFHQKWILHRAGHEAEFLTATESSTLANYGRVYETIENMNSFPADKGALYTLAAAVVIPALPVILAEIPFAVVLSDLLKALR
ncbi:MAG: hypothetical protein WCA00_09405 [Candidatus Acidiferrales bacterium]